MNGIVCEKCKIEMILKPQGRSEKVPVYRCTKCGAYTNMIEPGLLEWYDEFGRRFSPKGRFGDHDDG